MDCIDVAFLERTRDLMDTCVRDAKVFGYEDLSDTALISLNSPVGYAVRTFINDITTIP
ncbi:hypothetical protein [Methylovulum psychrotolerans]|uniref:PIN domain-containing protein n=1 Tax=Methylovulum psychrotolerans TaxID=1704499 RepID=A0A2S5CQX6_9GAMM|nr:hypothetical protein [Methylovulum psychrotolerans]POZ53176.1 PIN domain-containing protein [Methylovulum psychrotolerans]